MEPFFVLPVLAILFFGIVVVPASAGSMNPSSAATIPEWIQSVWDSWFNPPVFHSTVVGLGYDDHKQYAYLPGRAGGQWVNGGTGVNDDLYLYSTSNVAPSSDARIYLMPGTTGGVSVNQTTFYNTLSVKGGADFTGNLKVGGAGLGLSILSIEGTQVGDMAVLDILNIADAAAGTGAAIQFRGTGGVNGMGKISTMWEGPATSTGTYMKFLIRKGATPNTEIMRINGTGVCIGTSACDYQLRTTGTVRFSNFGAGTATFDVNGVVSSVSDEKIKTSIVPFTQGINAIKNINPIKFKYKPGNVYGLDSSYTYSGFSAQNVQGAMPEAVYSKLDTKSVIINDTQIEVPAGTSTLSIDDRAILAGLVNAIKEQQKEIEDLQARCR